VDTPEWLQIIEIAIASGALVFGIYEGIRRKKISNVLRTITKTFPGDVAKIEQSCSWAYDHVAAINTELAQLPDSPQKTVIIKHNGPAMGDTRASLSMCVALFNGLLSFQEAQFGTRDITHPQRSSLGLVNEDLKNRTSLARLQQGQQNV
jgi:hypothetical protein